MDAQTNPLTFTDAAALKVRALIDEEGDDSLMLRVFISGGGCSGFQYGFTFDQNETDGDTVVVNQGVKLLIDPMSFQYLSGAEIDYTVRHPQSQREHDLRLRLVVLGLNRGARTGRRPSSPPLRGIALASFSTRPQQLS
jgi:iron-sulfur cluster assembly accessory protein